jgi:hypothetical protein
LFALLKTLNRLLNNARADLPPVTLSLGAKWAGRLPEIEVTRLTSLSVEPLGRLGRLRVSLDTPVQLVPPDLDEGC